MFKDQRKEKCKAAFGLPFVFSGFDLQLYSCGGSGDIVKEYLLNRRGKAMATQFERKASVEAIKSHFENDVERFSNLETGQKSIIDSPLAMDLVARSASGSTANIRRVLDIGCGAGNYTLKLLHYVASFHCDLLDLSRPMLEKAHERISAVNTGSVRLFQGDFRLIELEEAGYDVILAAAVLHHLRDDDDWEAAFRKIFRLTAPGGSVWISDLVSHETGPVQNLMEERYGDYLSTVGGEEYRARVFEDIDREDSPRSVPYQLDLLRKVGFDHVELLHKNSCFAVFGAIKIDYNK
jgi:tRNA (cmo5U34)-methyltransferase